MTLDEAIEALRREVASPSLATLGVARSVIAAYDAERAEKAKACKSWCGKSGYCSRQRCYGIATTCFCSRECRNAGRPVNPKVAP